VCIQNRIGKMEEKEGEMEEINRIGKMEEKEGEMEEIIMWLRYHFFGRHAVFYNKTRS